MQGWVGALWRGLMACGGTGPMGSVLTAEHSRVQGGCPGPMGGVQVASLLPSAPRGTSTPASPIGGLRVTRVQAGPGGLSGIPRALTGFQPSWDGTIPCAS